VLLQPGPGAVAHPLPCRRLDQRGFGNSERPACCHGIDDLAADLVVFLDAVGLRRASLVGHSLGSFIARRVAETRPERVARLALLGSAVTGRQ
jgi:non-heme chloroperoxidase